MTKAPVPFSSKPIAYSLLVIAFFLPQPFFLPVFPYAFLALGAVWIVLVRRLTLLSIVAGLCLLAALVPPMLMSERWVSYIYLISSLSLIPMAAAVVRKLPGELMAAARLYLIGSLIAVFLGVAAFVTGAPIGIVFEDVSGVVRARGLNEEPNLMGFSLVVIYTLLLFYDRQRSSLFIFTVIWSLAFASYSIFAIGSLFIITLVHILWNRKFVPLAWLFLLFTLAAFLNIERISAIVQGIDNSANFRTWGAITVAYVVQQGNCGLTGCGIGSMRSVLQDHPLMESFSASDMLPNLVATAWLELGPLGVIIIFLIIYFAAFGSPFRRNVNLGLSVAAFYCLTSYALSGSYLYDPHFWSVVGLFTAVRRSWAIHPRSLLPREFNAQSRGRPGAFGSSDKRAPLIQRASVRL